MKKWHIVILGEDSNENVLVSASKLKRIDNNTVSADGVELEFSGEIDSINEVDISTSMDEVL